MGNKFIKQTWAQRNERVERPLVIDVDPDSTAIIVILMQDLTGETVAHVTIKIETDQAPEIVYDTVHHVVKETDLRFHLYNKRWACILHFEEGSNSQTKNAKIDSVVRVTSKDASCSLNRGHLYCMPVNQR